jgi:DNA polymerase I-like protein with 3'-5' exonuclease and polymerase domains
MKVYTLDFETYYDKEFSLRKMQTDAYIMDERYETIMVCIIDDEGKEDIIVGNESEIKEQLHAYADWSQCAIRAHNTLFDGYILSYRYGVKPKLWMDTLSQARMFLPYLKSHSLANVAKYLGIGAKGTAVHNMVGKRLSDMSASEFDDYVEYCFQDTRLCKALGERFDKFTPPLEMKLIDMTIRMFTEPTIVGDAELIEKLYKDEVARKEGLLAMAELDKETLNSSAKFAKRLEELGVRPPMKISPRTGKQTYAFAKTDKQFTALQDHENPEVQALVAARLGAKTTIAETRALRFLEMANRGKLPVYLNFWGAKTTGRYSGGNKVNWQNLPARGISAGLRLALKAPEGHKVLVGDSSNIELRTVMALAGQEDALDKIRAGVDMYCDFATKLFGREITKEDKAERFLGKTAMLGLQYGAGAERFQEMVRQGSQFMKGVEPISIERAMEVVQLWRSVHHRVVDLWRKCDKQVLPDIANGCNLLPVDVNGWFITQNNGFGRPGEPGVVYHNLEYNNDEWSYEMGGGRVKIYGPKVVENLCQHAAMKIVMWQSARINQRYPVKLSVHDEAVCIVPEEELTQAKAYMEECLDMTPPWCRGAIPVACETEIGDSYGDAK